MKKATGITSKTEALLEERIENLGIARRSSGKFKRSGAPSSASNIHICADETCNSGGDAGDGGAF